MFSVLPLGQRNVSRRSNQVCDACRERKVKVRVSMCLVVRSAVPNIVKTDELFDGVVSKCNWRHAWEALRFIPAVLSLYPRRTAMHVCKNSEGSERAIYAVR